MNSLINRTRVARDYLGRRVLCDGMPIEFSIELTSRCNLKCIMCPRDDNAERGLGNMSMETFTRIIDQAGRYLEFTYLHLAGEPLMHPRFGEFIDYAAEKGIKTGISTNGTILDEKRARVLIESKLSDLIISIDGTDAETYKKIRGANSFAKVVGNTQQFLRMKTEAGRGPRTVVQMICMNENSHQSKPFVRHWRSLGADAIRLKRFFNFAGNVEDRSVDQSGLIQLKRGNNGNNGKGAVSEDRASRSTRRAERRRPPCFLLWRQMAFYYDGAAVSCCHDFLHQSVLGNIHTQTLEEIWNSPQMAAMRQKHLEGRQDEIPLCSGCNQPNASVPIVLGTTALGAASTKKMMVAVERVARLAGIQAPY